MKDKSLALYTVQSRTGDVAIYFEPKVPALGRKLQATAAATRSHFQFSRLEFGRVAQLGEEI